MELKSRAEYALTDRPIHGLVVFGYGNPGRQDDGLGPAAVDEIARLGWPDIATQSNYQLNIEDAELAARHEWVIFVDAMTSGTEPYRIRQVHPARATSFSSHIVGPEVILAICRDYYGRVPPSVLVGIRGYTFELEEALSTPARHNLAQAVAAMKQLIAAGVERVRTLPTGASEPGA